MSGSGRDGLLRVGDGGSDGATAARRACRGAELCGGPGAAEERGSPGGGGRGLRRQSRWARRAGLFFFFSINRGGRLTASENQDFP